MTRKRKLLALIMAIALIGSLFCTIGFAAAEEAPAAEVAANVVSVDIDGEIAEYDLNDGEGAQAYVDSYADNLTNDPGFKTNIASAIAKIRESISKYATIWALVPPIIAILLALITKEVYSSLIIGIVVGGFIYAGGNFETAINHVLFDGFVASLSDSYNMGIIVFLVLLGALVAMMNKAGGSAAFGRWASKHIKSRVGAQLATILLGCLIFIDDYFNCLTVGSVMRPVCDEKKVSRAKLSYLIDATAAPICIIAPISSWAAAVAGFAKGAGADSGISLFINAIPYNFYAIFTIIMMVVLAVSKLDYGPMRLHEKNALEKGDLFTTGDRVSSDDIDANPKGRVPDLIIPVVVLIIACVFGMIYSGGFFSGENFIDAFSNSDASVGLVIGSAIAFVFTVVYLLVRRVISFKDAMGSLPEGFKAMVPAILILTCAWTLKAMTDSLGAKIFISQLVEGSAGAFKMFLPAIIFLIAVGLSFATGTSWGTFGILIPIVLSVFPAGDPLMIVSISACMAGAVCGDHCSPISDTTIMASAGAQSNHINHVSTQLPYALTVAGISFVTYVLAGAFAQVNVLAETKFADTAIAQVADKFNFALIALPVGIVLTVGILLIIKFATKKKS
ncbi:MAG: Na+/H+ antiporter NhaC family protein [Acutalibacteraceae bacterium]|nr:Na+/H+ antiporter NhaC family protein [Acutalibacteraceae bacterium]